MRGNTNPERPRVRGAALAKGACWAVGGFLLAVLLFPRWQDQTQSLRLENEQLRGQLAAMAAQSATLSNAAANLESSQRLAGQDFSELLRLRGQVGPLRTKAREGEAFQAENARLRAEVARLTEPIKRANIPLPTTSGEKVRDGMLLLDANQLEQAEAKFREAIKQDPTNEAAHYYLNVVHEKRASSQ
jgi:tetratricopeptide (TPR) repeat protein